MIKTRDSRTQTPDPARTWVLAAVLLFAAAAGGCLQESDEDSNDAGAQRPTEPGPIFADGTAAPRTITFHDCYEHGGSFPVPAEAFEDRLPEGFSVAPYTAFGELPPEPSSGTGEIYAAGSECGAADGTRFHRAIVSLFVEPPQVWQDPDVEFGYIFILSYVTVSQDNADVFAAWGFADTVKQGEVETDLLDTPALRIATTQASSDKTQFEIETVVVGQPTQLPGSMARFFAVTEGNETVRAADAEFGDLQTVLGESSLTGNAASGVWQDVPVKTGVGLHVWGHNNVWTWVEPPATGEA